MSNDHFLYRFRYAVKGGHTHVRLFAGNGTLSLGKCGDLVFRNEEFLDFMQQLNVPGARRIEKPKEGA